MKFRGGASGTMVPVSIPQYPLVAPPFVGALPIPPVGFPAGFAAPAIVWALPMPAAIPGPSRTLAAIDVKQYLQSLSPKHWLLVVNFRGDGAGRGYHACDRQQLERLLQEVDGGWVRVADLGSSFFCTQPLAKRQVKWVRRCILETWHGGPGLPRAHVTLVKAAKYK